MDQVMITKPELTLPPEAADLVRETYAKAQLILEYGSGGFPSAARSSGRAGGCRLIP